MSISFFKLTKILGLFLITLVIILNSLGLIYLYQESQAHSLDYKSLVKQQTAELKKLQEQQTQLSLQRLDQHCAASQFPKYGL